MKDFLPLETMRLLLRSFRPGDATAFHGWRNEADVARYTLWDFPYPMADAEVFCSQQSTLKPFPEGEWYQLLVAERESGKPLGDIGVGNAVELVGEGVISIGYSLSSAAHGKGYMTEALFALLPALAEHVGNHAFHAEIDARNAASGRVLEKLGFKAGDLQERRSFVKGEWCDEIDYDLNVADMLMAQENSFGCDCLK